MGIENNNGRDFKDLRGMRRSLKSLKRNDGERKGILIAPLMLPRFSRQLDCLLSYVSITALEGKAGFGPKFCGADGKPDKHFTSTYNHLTRWLESDKRRSDPSAIRELSWPETLKGRNEVAPASSATALSRSENI